MDEQGGSLPVMEFSNLPEELVLRVLSWLQHNRDIAAVGLTCRLCHRLANDKTLARVLTLLSFPSLHPLSIFSSPFPSSFPTHPN